MAVQRADEQSADARPGGQDLTGLEMRLITRNSAGAFILCGEGGAVAGVLSEGKAAGYWSSINTNGAPLRVVAGGAIAAGDTVMSNSQGKAVTGATKPFGVARNAVSYEDDIVEVMVDRT